MIIIIKRKHMHYLMLSLLFSFILYTNAVAVVPSIKVGLTIDVPTSSYGGTDADKATLTSKNDFTISFKNIDPINPEQITLDAAANEEFTFTTFGDKIRITKGESTWDAGSEVTVKPLDKGLMIVKKVYLSPPVAKNSDGSYKSYNKVYRGILKVTNRESSVKKKRVITVINILPVEEYLYGVVPREMGASWDLEALKAQAVAARTYALSHVKDTKYYNVTATTLHQVYGGFGTLEGSKIVDYETFDGKYKNAVQAVNETKGKVAKYNGKYISALYSSNAGGKTESAKNVWGNDYPYLVSVESPWDSIGGTAFQWTETFDRFKLENKLKIYGIQGVYFENYTLAGRAHYLCVKTSAGVIKLSKSEWQSPLGLKSRKVKVKTQNPTSIDNPASYVEGNDVTVLTANGNQTIKLKDIYVISGENNVAVSADYQALGIDIIPTKYIFNGYGYGHGVGMSQFGALGMARKGNKYDDILTHYYTDIKIVDEY